MDFPRDFGPYRLVKQIAVGGMAEIVLAKTKGFGGFEKVLALKMIHPRLAADQHFINMLIEEAKICVELSHANICQVFDLGRIDDAHFLAMEYVEGVDVFKMMRRATEIGYEMPIENCLYIGQEICAGLDYAHNKRDSEGRPLGIIHRDISPQNILISFAGEVKIVDFGIAKAGLRAKQTEVGVIKGKYYYMSPEQAWADPVDHRTDIFSAGIIIYEMLTGQMLYLEENIEVLLDRVRKADIEPPSRLRPEIPPELDDIIMKALSKYSEERFQSAREMGQALGNFLYSFSPDYTASRLASMMAWLFDEEINEAEAQLDVPPRRTKERTDSLLLTREDFVKKIPGAGGSLLFDLTELAELEDPEGDEPLANLMGEFGATAEMGLPDGEHTARIDMEEDFEETSQVELPYDLRRFPDQPGEPSDRGDTSLDVPNLTDLQTEELAEATTQRSRKPDEDTSIIAPAELLGGEEKPARPAPSYQPPPPPGFEPKKLSRPPSAYSPPSPGKLGGPRAPSPKPSRPPSSSRPPPASRTETTAASAPEDTFRTATSSLPAPKLPAPKAPRAPVGPPARPLERPAPRAPLSFPTRSPEPRERGDSPIPDVLTSVPSFSAKDRSEPGERVGPPAQKLPVPSGPDLPSAEPPGPDPEDRTSPHSSLPSTRDRRPSGPPLVASARGFSAPPDEEIPRPRPATVEVDDPTDLTAYVPPEAQVEAPSEPSTGQTSLITRRLEGRPERASERSLPRLHDKDDDSQPTAVIPGRRETNGVTPPTEPRDQPADRTESEPQKGVQLFTHDTVGRSSAHLRDQGPSRLAPPAKAPAQPPPWMISNEPFGGRESSAPPWEEDPEMLDEEVLDGPPDYDDDDFVEAAVQRFNLKPVLLVALPSLAVAALIVAAYMLWPRPEPVSRLDIRSHPAGAQVIFDGQPLAKRTPATVENLEVGSVHQVELRLDGFVTWRQPVEIRSTEVRQIAILRPILGTLRVTSEPPGASVSIDGVYQGTTPLEIDELDINRDIRVQVRYDSDSRSRTMDWAGETEAALHFEFPDVEPRRSRFR